MFVGRGNMYSVYWPLLTSRRDTRSVDMDPVHASPLRSSTASYGALHGVGTFHSVIFSVSGSTLSIDASAPRAGVRSRSRVHCRLLGLRIDFHDIPGGKIE